jgi:hypothetical protein
MLSSRGRGESYSQMGLWAIPFRPFPLPPENV